MSQVIAREIQSLEMAPDEAIVSLFEIELVTGSPFYFHAENTESTIKFKNDGVNTRDYEPFPMELQGVETRGDGAQNRPKLTIPNVDEKSPNVD